MLQQVSKIPPKLLLFSSYIINSYDRYHASVYI